MVHVFRDYYVTADNYCYTAVIDTHTVDKENKKIYKNVGYYSNLEDATKGIQKHAERRLVMAEDCELKELIECLKQLRDEIHGIGK